MEFDHDLYSIQEVRNAVAAAKAAQAIYGTFDQTKIDGIIAKIAQACAANAECLAKMAVEETGFGVWQDKVLKNLLGSTMTYDYIKDMKTVGVLRDDRENGLMEIGVPMGVVAALIPSTNPTSTVMYKVLIALKAGNGIVISPHPSAKGCIAETFKIIRQAACAAGVPDGLIQCLMNPSKEGTDALLRHRDIGIILATGGEAMVRAAYSSGNPALGVGPGFLLFRHLATGAGLLGLLDSGGLLLGSGLRYLGFAHALTTFSQSAANFAKPWSVRGCMTHFFIAE